MIYKIKDIEIKSYTYIHSLSEAFILASINPKYVNRLFIELRVHYTKISSSEHVVYINCVFVLTFETIYVHDMF